MNITTTIHFRDEGVEVKLRNHLNEEKPFLVVDIDNMVEMFFSFESFKDFYKKLTKIKKELNK
jgi:hypothetical protein